MKARIPLLALCVMLAAVPAAAQTLYDNGPINGNTDAWTINFGYAVSDTFNLYYGATVTGASFAMWLIPDDTLTSAELSITSLPFGGTSYFDRTVNFTTGPCNGNQYGYYVCQENTAFNGPNLTAGTYWLTLQNASVPSGDPVYWDENSGPSRSRELGLPVLPIVGTIPSESFTILGGNSTTCMCGCGVKPDCEASAAAASQSVPEPGSMILLGSEWVALFGVLRRKFL
jgi:hypothetical protein